MKKILFVINSLNCGGAEKSLVSLLSTIDYNRYDVYLLMFRQEGMLLNLLPQEVHILPQPEYMSFLEQPWWKQLQSPKFLRTRLQVSMELRRNHELHDAQCFWKQANKAFQPLATRYDAAIAWGQGNPTHFVAEKVQADKKIAVINANYSVVGYKKAFDFPFYKQFDHIVAVSKELHKRIADVFPELQDRIRTIYDINNASLISSMALLSNPVSKDSTTKIIVTVGRLTKQKGYDLATHACAYLKDKNIRFRWYIVGEGPERKQIEQDIVKYRLQEYMVLVGEQENPYAYMKQADVYVQPSRSEGYCLTLCEARILNIPIVATNFDVVYDQLVSGENGLVVEMNPEEIAKGILQMLTDEELREHVIQTVKREKKGNTEEIEKLYRLIEDEDSPTIDRTV